MAGNETAAASPVPKITDEQVEALAAYYHQAICRQMLTVAWADRIKAGQSMSYIPQFLALSRDRAGSSLTGALKHFVTAGCWMGRNRQTSLMDKLRAGYRPTLLAASRRVLTDFAASQPEADIGGTG